MGRLLVGAGGVLLAGALGWVLTLRGASAAPSYAVAAPPVPPRPTSTGIPVLVELFTSEGCSSCPPADRALARIVETQPVPGARAIVIAHHVDYWNRLGWADPFSSAEASDRQRAYASLRSGSYTPQAVIDGQAEMIGSRSEAVEAAIGAAARRAHASVTLSLARGDAGHVEATVAVGKLPADATDDAELVVAVLQERGRVDVPRGENAGQRLAHVAIAREVRVAFGVSRTGTPAQKTTLRLPEAVAAPEGSRFSVVAFVQERSRRQVHGTAIAIVPDRPGG